jgi:16S rRNA (guanine527-N7)-methyltransferase
LVEADQRKAAFLRCVVAELGLTNATVHARRAEQLDFRSEVVTARAFAPIERLLPVAARCLTPGGSILLLLGPTAANLTSRNWSYQLTVMPSRSGTGSFVAVLTEVRPTR